MPGADPQLHDGREQNMLGIVLIIFCQLEQLPYAHLYSLPFARQHL